METSTMVDVGGGCGRCGGVSLDGEAKGLLAGTSRTLAVDEGGSGGTGTLAPPVSVRAAPKAAGSAWSRLDYCPQGKRLAFNRSQPLPPMTLNALRCHLPKPSAQPPLNNAFGLGGWALGEAASAGRAHLEVDVAACRVGAHFGRAEARRARVLHQAAADVLQHLCAREREAGRGRGEQEVAACTRLFALERTGQVLATCYIDPPPFGP
eukprot:6187606-Pleurochrysis_carterae.AAC.2